MERDPIRIPAGTTIAAAAQDFLLRHDHDAFCVEDDGRVIGIVTLESVRVVTRSDWRKHPIEEVMNPVTADTIVDPHTSMDNVLDKFESAAESVAVGYPDRVVGVITPRNLTSWMNRRSALAT
jgi:CBS domain-containing protein